MVRTGILLNPTNAPAPAEPRLAGLPLFLRAVLSAQRAGLEEITIVGGPNPERLLGRDPRVKIKWRWLRAGKDEESPGEVEALRQVAGELKEPFLLLFADSVLEPTALAQLAEAGLERHWARVPARAGVEETELEAASLFLCSPEFVRVLEQAKGSERVGAVVARLRAGQGPTGEDGVRADAVEVDGRVWPRTTDPARLRALDQEIARLHVKPSDSIFARFNKLVMAQALIRFFLRTPATPNFITGLGLLLALGSGWAFAQGSYGWSIAGAFIAYLSALMDHVDGMVARLKFLESDFGVWFESAVDYASYLCIFVGLAIGLYRETGFVHHLVVGGLFLFGWVLSFILMSRQRQRASGDDPADYPNRMHRQLEQHSRNLFHWLARKFYFLVRRAVLPYFILLFCVLDLRVLLLGWVTFGANLVWLLTLYNNRLFRAVAKAPAAD